MPDQATFATRADGRTVLAHGKCQVVTAAARGGASLLTLDSTRTSRQLFCRRKKPHEEQRSAGRESAGALLRLLGRHHEAASACTAKLPARRDTNSGMRYGVPRSRQQRRAHEPAAMLALVSGLETALKPHIGAQRSLPESLPCKRAGGAARDPPLSG